jgi:hypothetical protein
MVVLAFLLLRDVCCTSEAGTATCGLIVGHGNIIRSLTRNKEAAAAKRATQDVAGKIEMKILRRIYWKQNMLWEM